MKRIVRGNKLSNFLFGSSDESVRVYQSSAAYPKIVKNVSLCGIAFTMMVTPLNLMQGYYMSQITNIGIFLVFVLAYVLFKKERNHGGRSVLLVGLSVLLSVYTISGQSDGFAVLWTIAVPLISMWLFGLRKGLYVSLYFLGLMTVLFYTPLREKMVYSEIFMLGYPALFLCIIALSLFIMREYYAYQLRQFTHEQELKQAVQAERENVESLSLQIIMSICNAVEAKDKYTNEHSLRVAYISCMIAQELDWPPERVDVLRKIAMLHDIGKIGIRDSVLNKPDKLTDEEYAQMKQHTLIGAEILKELTTLPNVDLGAKYHHERYDGKGYPCGLAGEEIPIEARIIGVADAFDAMSSRRIYREVCEEDYVFEELARGRGTQFDPVMVDALLRAMGRSVGEPEKFLAEDLEAAQTE